MGRACMSGDYRAVRLGVVLLTNFVAFARRCLPWATYERARLQVLHLGSVGPANTLAGNRDVLGQVSEVIENYKK